MMDSIASYFTVSNLILESIHGGRSTEYRESGSCNPPKMVEKGSSLKRKHTLF